MAVKILDPPVQFLLYGDQTVEKLPAIKLLVEYSRTSEVIRRFLRDACDAVQYETTKLRPDERSNITDFDSLLQLAEENDKSDSPSEIVATVLMNVARLGELILWVPVMTCLFSCPARATLISPHQICRRRFQCSRLRGKSQSCSRLLYRRDSCRHCSGSTRHYPIISIVPFNRSHYISLCT